MVGANLAILMSWTMLVSSSLLMMRVKTSITKTNKKGDSRTPWRRPLPRLKKTLRSIEHIREGNRRYALMNPLSPSIRETKTSQDLNEGTLVNSVS